MINNLFHYATSELSQDAFICWLLSHAVKGCQKDGAIAACAKDFIRFFIPELEGEDVYLSEPPRRQYKSIDILLTVNDRYKVIIEDKTHTSDHDNQLVRYRETVAEDFPEYSVVGVYYKIGFQSDLGNVTDADYIICDREKILSILEKYITDNKSDIFRNYYDYLNDFNNKANEFRSLPVEQWSWEQINGFYKYCQDSLNDTGMNFGFGYVHNMAGGFYGMWMWKPIYIDADGLRCEVYLQCEYTDGTFNICYRASNKDDGNSEQRITKSVREALIWKYACGTWINVAKKHNFKKPQRYGTGKSVALGVYDTAVGTYEEAVAAIRCAINDFYAMVDELQASE